MSRLGGIFGRGRNEDEQSQREGWKTGGPGGLKPYGEDDLPGQVRVLGDTDASQEGVVPLSSPDAAPPAAPNPEYALPPRFNNTFSFTPPPPETQVALTDEEVRLEDLLPSAQSERLERWTELLRQQASFYEESVGSLERESRGLQSYLDEQRRTMESMTGKLEEQLRPLKAYIANEQANLDRLRSQMDERPAHLVGSHVGEYLRSQQDRVDRGRDEVTAQYQPLQEYFAEQQHLVETLMGKFDDDLKKLSQTLGEQKRVMDRVQRGLTDDEFVAGTAYLSERQQAWNDFARSSDDDPARIYDRLGEIQSIATRNLKPSQSTLEHLYGLARAADDRLSGYVPAAAALPPAQSALPAVEPESEPAEPATQDDESPIDAFLRARAGGRSQ